MLKLFLNIISTLSRQQDGQILILAVGIFIVVLLMAAMVIDGGLFLGARRDSQNAADAAALAGAQHLPDGQIAAEDAALAWASLNGWTDGVDETAITVTTPYEDDEKKIEVIVEGPAKGVQFFSPLLSVSSRAVAEVVIAGTGDSGPGSGVLPVPVAECGTDQADVDGRVIAGEGYEKFGDLVGGSTVFGQGFFACDPDFFYFALRLNGPSTGGAVANENVYGPGTYHVLYGTGWEDDRHTFADLKNSDRARFRVSCGGVIRHDFIQDYLRPDGSGWASDTAGNGKVFVAGPAASASSLEWNLEHPSETGWGDYPDDEKQRQSPPFDPSYPTYDDEVYNGWVWEMIYEFKVPHCGETVLFGLPDFSGSFGTVAGIHSSPPKDSEGESVILSTREILLVE